MPSPKLSSKLILLGSLYISQLMPFWFLSEALPVLLRQQGLPLEALGLLPLVAIASIFKFLWAPLIDRYSIQRWGHYRFWIITFQAIVMLITFACSALSLDEHLPLILLSLFLLGIGCASQDIATDALALQLLRPEERGVGNAVQGVGGSIGKMIGGGGMLIMLNRWGWKLSLIALAILMLIALLPLLLFDESRDVRATPKEISSFGLNEYLDIFRGFYRQPNAKLWLVIIALYAAAHSLSFTMFRPLLVDLELSISEIGSLLGILGTGMTMIGASIAGVIISRWGRRRSLLIASTLALLGILTYFLPTFGYSQLWVLRVIVGVVFLSLGAIGTTSFTIMMDKSRFETAGTDYTLQTSFIAIGGIIAAAFSGILANQIGYRGVFSSSALLLIACIILIAKYFQPTVYKCSADSDLRF